MRIWESVILAVTIAAAGGAGALDHNHTAWHELLQRHVRVQANGSVSRVDYAAFKREEAALNAYLDGLAAVTPPEYRDWPREQQLAFLINAYNAYTVKLVLTRYPALKSIKDLGSFLQSPWKQAIFPLLGDKRSLDDIEHRMIRAPGAFDEPRIHFALNCASVGCPMLREEAYVATKLDAQLESGVQRFLSDRARNRYDSAAGRLEVSLIFDWYKADFERGSRGSASVPQFLGRYAEYIADDAAGRAAVRRAALPLRFLDYDWNLNDAAR